jgi:hypothetical protein
LYNRRVGPAVCNPASVRIIELMPLRIALLTTVSLLASLALAGVAAASGQAPALTPAPDDALTRALASGGLTEAEYALERAVTVFDQPAATQPHSAIAAIDPRGATLVLRDLVARLGQLDAASRRRAESLLARPTDGAADTFGSGYTVAENAPVCTDRACVHWVPTTGDAPPPADADANGSPDQVDLTLQTINEVWQREVVEFGYRPPKDDSTSLNPGPDGHIDVYLKNIGVDGLYGYCTTDDPSAAQTPNGPWDVSAYCVLDNDYAAGEFPASVTPLAALQVTVAHEFFHAIQFGYDFFDDPWMLEGTAVWMEDEVYDDVNDNYQYLDRSPLSRPHIPLDFAVRDQSNPLSDYVYGSFVFFRHLSEHFGGPDVIRRTWEFADGAPGAPDEFSLQAVDSALRERGSSARDAFTRFGAVNALPGTFYEEGASYPTPPVDARRVLTSRRPETKGAPKLDHLTTWYGLFRPGTGVTKGTRLRIVLDLPARATGATATLVIMRRSGSPKLLPVQLSANGAGTRIVTGFDPSSIESVRLILSNASERFLCGQGLLPLACFGLPIDDGRTFSYEARLLGA